MLSGAAPGGRLAKPVAGLLDEIGAERAGAEGKAKALVFDATGIADSTELVELQRFFYPAVGRLRRSGRVVVLGTPPAAGRLAPAPTPRSGRSRASPARSAKEIGGRGATAQLVYVAPGAEDQLASTLRFLLSPRSAYVSGQVVRIGDGRRARPELDWEQPLAGKVALVTGASRGIGAAIATRAGPRRRRGGRARHAAAAEELRADGELGGERDRPRHHRRRTPRSRSPSASPTASTSSSTTPA